MLLQKQIDGTNSLWYFPIKIYLMIMNIKCFWPNHINITSGKPHAKIIYYPGLPDIYLKCIYSARKSPWFILPRKYSKLWNFNNTCIIQLNNSVLDFTYYETGIKSSSLSWLRDFLSSVTRELTNIRAVKLLQNNLPTLWEVKQMLK